MRQQRQQSDEERRRQRQTHVDFDESGFSRRRLMVSLARCARACSEELASLSSSHERWGLTRPVECVSFFWRRERERDWRKEKKNVKPSILMVDELTKKKKNAQATVLSAPRHSESTRQRLEETEQTSLTESTRQKRTWKRRTKEDKKRERKGDVDDQDVFVFRQKEIRESGIFFFFFSFSLFFLRATSSTLPRVSKKKGGKKLPATTAARDLAPAAIKCYFKINERRRRKCF